MLFRRGETEVGPSPAVFVPAAPSNISLALKAIDLRGPEPPHPKTTSLTIVASRGVAGEPLCAQAFLTEVVGGAFRPYRLLGDAIAPLVPKANERRY
mmetsp:Transcript_121206/g.241442  ORF Transcript_121206/g.241442 Transcript_121206/m.241442 type:complete len:97 (-) Transcript_121206:36-326(-)